MAGGKEFYGRTKELDWLKNLFFQVSSEMEPDPIGLINGKEGIGKTRLVQQFIYLNFRGKSSHPAAVFDWKGQVRVTSVLQFAEDLLKSGWSNVPELEAQKQLLQQPLLPVSPKGPQDLEGNPETYDSEGFSRDNPIPPPLSPPGQDLELSRNFASTLSEWLLETPNVPDIGTDALFRLVFVFDSFETYPTLVKTWLGKSLFPTIKEMAGLPRRVYLLTGRQAWEIGGQADYWDAFPGAFSQFNLAALERHDCEDWLKMAGKPLNLVDVLMEESEGVPGRIEKILSRPGLLEKLAVRESDPSDPLSDFSATQRRWLHASAMARIVTLEAMEILLGRVEGQQAFGWLSSQPELCHVDGNTEGTFRLVLRPELRDEVIRRVTSKVPSRHGEFLEKLNLLTRVTTKVPVFDHRTHLRRLSPVQPFDRELLREVFNFDAQ